jgi:hypothetical protein
MSVMTDPDTGQPHQPDRWTGQVRGDETEKGMAAHCRYIGQQVDTVTPTGPPLPPATSPRTASCLTPHGTTGEEPGWTPSHITWQYWMEQPPTLQYDNTAVPKYCSTTTQQPHNTAVQ